jgi:N utilization substance protein B
MTGTRHKARTIALQALYEIDSVAHESGPAVDHLLEETELPEEYAEFTRELVNGVLEHREDIDRSIHKHAPTWPVDQISVVDRNILRLAIFEILFNNKVPVKVAVSEAVELAKSFGSETSAKFVNGVLGSVSAVADREN